MLASWSLKFLASWNWKLTNCIYLDLKEKTEEMLVLVSVFAQYSMYSSTHLEHIWNTCTLCTVQYAVVYTQCTLCTVYCRSSVQSNLLCVQSSVKSNAQPMHMYIIYSPVYSSAHPVYIVHSLVYMLVYSPMHSQCICILYTAQSTVVHIQCTLCTV